MPGMQFLMALALRMGRTLGELRQSMTASELMMWAEYDSLSPIGDVRSDILSAQVVSAIYGAQGAKVALDEAQIQWTHGDALSSGDSDPFAGLDAALFSASQ